HRARPRDFRPHCVSDPAAEECPLMHAVARHRSPKAVAAPPGHERRGAHRIYREILVGGLRTACLSRNQLATLMVGDCLAARGGKRRPRLVFASNGHAIALAATDAEFREYFH